MNTQVLLTCLAHAGLGHELDKPRTQFKLNIAYNSSAQGG